MLKRALIIFVGVYGITVLTLALGCGRKDPVSDRPSTVAEATTQTSQSCRECHEPIYQAWAGTDHALANRSVDAKSDAAAFASFHPPAGVGPGTSPDLILGHKPLWQPLLPAPGGRWQPHELAYDPAKQEWFNVFGDENRRPGEWGHWTGRGMNWNSMCAACHMTGYRKNYDPGADSYHSTWVEQGIGCIQCHGPTDAQHGKSKKVAEPSRPQPPFFGDRQKMMQTCAPCHARNQPLTDRFQPGDDYAQHYRMVLPVNAATFYPDGQQRDEDFNWTSVQLSRMAHAGVTCFDCHDPHTLKTVLPTQDNQLCLQCHAAPGRQQPNGTRAIAIDPVSHSHHQAGSAGNQCVSCHMSTTTYMQRSPRHDHGWLKPDPLLTKELGIPNACSKCHTDKPVEWVIEKADEWYGGKLDSRQRARARAVSAAQADQRVAGNGLLALLEKEDIPAWRATYLTLLASCSDRDEQRAQAAASAALKAKDPLERSAGISLLATFQNGAESIRPLLNDPILLVRLDATWALSPELAADSPARKELDQHLVLDLDQPAGRYRVAQDLANRGRYADAERELAKAIEWDPNSAGFYDSLAMIKAAQGQSLEAAETMRRAAELAPQSGTQAMRVALAYSEAGRAAEAERWLQEAVRREPNLDRAWYNLGLALAARNALGESLAALQRAASLRADSSEYHFACATVQVRQGDLAGAKQSAAKALSLDPRNAAAAELLKKLGSSPP